ncbi:MAG TPA: radical SAM protein [Nitrospiraceae bacterium]|nr:radical SAM protein [Nitrospiraceae bacterium]
MTCLNNTSYSQIMLYQNHSRSFKENRYVYPVLSRRSKGISVGINLNPDKVCNFNCIYCQVDRNGSAPGISVDISQICRELAETLEMIKTGEIFLIPPFDKVPPELRHISDIAISGDGEPTMFPGFYEVVKEVLKIKEEWEERGHFPLVLITNSTGLNRPKVQDAIDLIYKNNGEVWLKLDAGSEDFHKKVSGSDIPLKVIIQNIKSVAIRHPVVIQSCFFRIDNSPFPISEIEDYCLLLKEIVESGGKIRLIQIYTVARPPREDYVSPLSQNELNFIADKVHELTNIPTEIYP